MGRITKAISFQSEEQAAAFDAIAQKLGYNRSGLIQAMGDKKITPLPMSTDVQAALVAAAIALQNTGSEYSADLISLLSNIQLSQPLSKQLEQMGNREAGWVEQAKKLISERKAFTLEYHGKERLIRYAEIAHRDNREYLHCWVDKPTSQPDLPELAHNRLFFVGETAQLKPSRAKWRNQGLDSIETTFRVAFRYRPKPEDQLIQEVEAVTVEGKEWTRVTQRVTNLLWFLQRVARYGDRCVIEAPSTIQELYVQQLTETLKLYEAKEN